MANRKTNQFSIATGISGLSFAVGLLQYNVPFQVYEATSQLTDFRTGICFDPNGLKAMDLMSPAMLAQFKRLATKNSCLGEEDTFINFRQGQGEQQGELIASVKSYDQAKTGMSSVHHGQFLA